MFMSALRRSATTTMASSSSVMRTFQKGSNIASATTRSTLFHSRLPQQKQLVMPYTSWSFLGSSSTLLQNAISNASSPGLVSSMTMMNTNQQQLSSNHQQNQVRHRSGRSRRGLYDGKDIRSGNNVSFSMKKTKRKFKPNVFKKRVYSDTLGKMIQFRLTASALRSIDKAGGLDNYLLTSKHVTEGRGLKMKNVIRKRMKSDEKLRLRREAAAMQIDDVATA